jgi:hypothetical protein
VRFSALTESASLNCGVSDGQGWKKAKHDVVDSENMASFMLLLAFAAAQDVVIGVNVVNPMRASAADQDVVLS